jgi:hypothetical protein
MGDRDFGFWIKTHHHYISSEEGGFERISGSGKCGLGVSPSRAPFQDRSVIRFINPPLQTSLPLTPTPVKVSVCTKRSGK